MRISLFRSLTDTSPNEVDFTWGDLVETLTTFDFTSCGASCMRRNCPDKKRGAGWSPVTMKPGTNRRADVNVATVEAAVFDIDHVTEDEYFALLDRLSAAGIAQVWHSTHSHLAPDDCALRLVMPLSRPATAAEWPALRAAVIAKYQIPADKVTKNLSRFFFLPSAPEGTEELAVGLHLAGSALPVVLLVAPQTSPKPAQALPAPTPATTLGAVDMDALRACLERIPDDKKREIVKLALAGKPFAPEGERDNTVNTLMSTLAFRFPAGTPVEAAVELVRSGVLALPGLPPDGAENWLAKAVDSYERACARRDEKDARDAEKRASLLAAFTRSSAAADAPAEPDAPAPEEDGSYSEEQIAAWAQEHHAEDFQRRWIIQKGKAFWVFVNGRYQTPVGLDELVVTLPRDLARAPVDFNRTTKQGVRPAKPMEILLEHATVARDIQASLSLQETYYDPTTQTLHEAVCPLRRDIRAVEHPEIQRWLELLGGPQADRLLDWVATIHLLDRQTCALYLDLPPGAGKTLLAHGLARDWHRGPPTELERILEGFNDGLTQCPLVFADERLPELPGITGTLRRFIGSSSRTLARKFMPSAVLGGSPRVMIAGNNERLLQQHDEDLGTDDHDAVSERILYVNPGSTAPSEYLAQLGGPAVLNTWVSEDKIAEHRRWLSTQRTVNQTSRFLVSGIDTGSSFHAGLSTATRTASAVVEYLVRVLSERNTLPTTIQIGSGELWVNTEAIMSGTWTNRIPAEKLPTTTRIGRILSTMEVSRGASIRTVVGARQLTFHRLKPQVLLQWATQHQVGDVEAIETKLKTANEIIEKHK